MSWKQLVEDGLIYSRTFVQNPMYIGPSVTTFTVEYRTRGKAWYHFYIDKPDGRLLLVDIERHGYVLLERMGCTGLPPGYFGWECLVSRLIDFFHWTFGMKGRKHWLKLFWRPRAGLPPLS